MIRLAYFALVLIVWDKVDDQHDNEQQYDGYIADQRAYQIRVDESGRAILYSDSNIYLGKYWTLDAAKHAAERGAGPHDGN
jgi:hypothetical protein